MPDHLGFSLNCPHCAERLIFLRTEGQTHLYVCPAHGTLALPPDGRLRKLWPDGDERA